MNGLDQIIVTLWFFPVIAFIIIPLCLTCVWGIISLLIPFKQMSGERTSPVTVAENPVG